MLLVFVDIPQSYDGTLLKIWPTAMQVGKPTTTLNRTPPPRPFVFVGITRTRNLCWFCRTFISVPSAYVSSVRLWHIWLACGCSIFLLARSFCNFITPVPQYQELLWVLYKLSSTNPEPLEKVTTKAVIVAFLSNHWASWRGCTKQ